MKPTGKQVVLTVRLDEGEHATLKTVAERNRRSVAQQVRRWIEEAADDRERQEATA